MLSLWWVGGRGASAPPEAYRIDFIGPTTAIINRNPDSTPAAAKAPSEATPPAPGKPPPMSLEDNFSLQRRRRPLPRPSILSRQTRPQSGETTVSSPTRETPPAGQGAGPADASVSADMPNFPYPWYISQIRASLWSQWSARMPEGRGEAVIMFSLLPGGQMVDLRVESSSGDSSFDFFALTAAQEAAPFPPLPRSFREPFLKVHVRMRSQ